MTSIDVFDWATQCPEYIQPAATSKSDVRSLIYAAANQVARGQAVTA